MFTGLIEALGQVVGFEPAAGVHRLTLAARWPDDEPTARGDSVAVNGCCLTAVACQRGPDGAERLVFELSAETVARTAFGAVRSGESVNLERAARIGQRLGGHLVTGHVDGTATLLAIHPSGGAFDVTYAVPADLEPELVVKGSVALDGVSLTVNALPPGRLQVTLIPHTVAHTQLLQGGAGKTVNVETDLIAKHMRRLAILAAR
ncbi:MAG: riboflavin synthase [Deltaproteobacteria bacterium]|nr:riboflavin synthase [Deltaproteobacteria bacterium]